MSIKSRMLSLWNFWPPFLFTGIRIDKRTSDFKEVNARLKLRFWNANYVGTQYGGSIFSLADPFYMVMWMKNLGRGYSVWDKGATIRYLKPGKSDLFAHFEITDEEIKAMREKLDHEIKAEWKITVFIYDKDGNLIAEVDKILSLKKLG